MTQLGDFRRAEGRAFIERGEEDRFCGLQSADGVEDGRELESGRGGVSEDDAENDASELFIAENGGKRAAIEVGIDEGLRSEVEWV